MNINDVVYQLDNQIFRTSNDVDSVVASNDIAGNPQAMLKAQYALQQYSVMIGYQSAVMKAVKDMMSGIISKIG